MSLPAGAPVVHPITQQWYEMLPELYQVADVSPGGALLFPLLRFMSLLGDLFGADTDLIDRISMTVVQGAEVSQLVDPVLGDESWLMWQAQLVGAKLTGYEPETTKRATIASASNGWRAGTKDSMAAAARTQLTGSQTVEILDHQTDSGGGGEWDVLVRTRAIETPDNQAVLDAINAAGVKPAGVKLWLGHTAASWDALEAAYPTNADWDVLTWDEIESTLDTGTVLPPETVIPGENIYPGPDTYPG